MDKKATLDAAEKTLDAIEPVLDEIEATFETVERIPRLRLNGTTRKQQIIILAVTATSAAVASGALVGWIVKKRLTLRYDAIVEHEVAEARAFYQQLTKPPMEELAGRHASRDPEDVEASTVIKAAESLRRYDGSDRVIADKAEVPETVTQNIFVEGKPMDVDFDYEAEIANRSEERPYVISYDEFQQGEKDYVQNTLTWYDGDDTLTDDKDQPIEETDRVVGDNNLHRFGHGSRDSRIVYIRNDVMEIDFEVVKHTGSYAQSVLGFKHSYERPGSRKTLRYRGDDG